MFYNFTIVTSIFMQSPKINGGSTSPAPKLITDFGLGLLWPQPMLMRQLADQTVTLPKELHLSVSVGRDISTHDVAEEVFKFSAFSASFGFRILMHPSHPASDKPTETTSKAASFHIHVNPARHRMPESYTLHVGTDASLRISSGDLLGVHHAMTTLVQLLRLHGENNALVPVRIEDRPFNAVRAVLVDMNVFGRAPKLVRYRRSLHS
jgi:hypothetical protein